MMLSALTLCARSFLGYGDVVNIVESTIMTKEHGHTVGVFLWSVSVDFREGCIKEVSVFGETMI